MASDKEPTYGLIDSVSKPMPIWLFLAAVILTIVLAIFFGNSEPYDRIDETPPSVVTIIFLLAVLVVLWYLGWKNDPRKEHRNGQEN